MPIELRDSNNKVKVSVLAYYKVVKIIDNLSNNYLGRNIL